MDSEVFRTGSERLELSPNAVAQIANGCPAHTAWYLLYALQLADVRYGDAIDEALGQLAALSDSPISWSKGRGRSGIARVPDAVFPHRWSSAHEAALAIARMSLEFFYWPLALDEKQARLSLEEQPTAVRKQFGKLLHEERRKALAMGMEEIADLQERIRRERAKLLGNGPPVGLPANDLQNGVSKQEAKPQLTTNEYGILQQLARNAPQLTKITDLAADLNARRGAIGEAVQRLELLEMVERPLGERKGVGITGKGRDSLRDCDKPRGETGR